MGQCFSMPKRAKDLIEYGELKDYSVDKSVLSNKLMENPVDVEFTVVRKTLYPDLPAIEYTPENKPSAHLKDGQTDVTKEVVTDVTKEVVTDVPKEVGTDGTTKAEPPAVLPFFDAGCDDDCVAFCEDCSFRLCADHKEAHDNWFGSTHTYALFDDYCRVPEKYDQVICHIHADRPVEYACHHCYLLMCSDCNSGAACTAKGPGCKYKQRGMHCHQPESLKKWRPQLVVEYQQMVDRIVEIQRELGTDYDSWWGSEDNLYEEVYTPSLNSRHKMLETIKVDVLRLMTDCHVVEMLRRRNATRRKVKRMLEKFGEIRSTGTNFAVSGGQHAQGMRMIPRKLLEPREVEIYGYYESRHNLVLTDNGDLLFCNTKINASWNNFGITERVVIVGDDGIHKYSTHVKNVTSLAQKRHFVFLLRRECSIMICDRYDNRLCNKREICRFVSGSYETNAHSIAISDSTVVLLQKPTSALWSNAAHPYPYTYNTAPTSAGSNGNIYIQVYSYYGRNIRNTRIDTANADSVWMLDENHVVIKGGTPFITASLSKYNITQASSGAALWTYTAYQIEDVTVGQSGIIYAAVYADQHSSLPRISIVLLGTFGEVLGNLQLKDSFDRTFSRYQVSVKNNTLALVKNNQSVSLHLLAYTA